MKIRIILGVLTLFSMGAGYSFFYQSGDEAEAHAILRPFYDETENVTRWGVIEDSGHIGPHLLSSPYVVGNAVRMDFDQNVRIKYGHLTHDGQLANYYPGLSINSSRVGYTIRAMRDPYLRIQIRIDKNKDGTRPYDIPPPGGHDAFVTSWTETPNDETGFDDIKIIQIGNRISLYFDGHDEFGVKHEYLGLPKLVATHGVQTRYVYPGASKDATEIHFDLFSSYGDPIEQLPPNCRLTLERRYKGPEKLIDVDPCDPRITKMPNGNYWFNGKFEIR